MIYEGERGDMEMEENSDKDAPRLVTEKRLWSEARKRDTIERKQEECSE